MSKKSGYVPKTFREARTETTYEGGQNHDFDPGAYDNYKAAGLITDGPADAKAPKGKDAKTPEGGA